LSDPYSKKENALDIYLGDISYKLSALLYQGTLKGEVSLYG